MLREEIKLQLNGAIKNKEKKSISTLRLVMAAIKDRDIAARSKGNNFGISEDEIKLLLQTMIKQRKESSQIYESAGRKELFESEQEEIKIISNFLPKQMSEVEIANAIETVIAEIDSKSIKDMGKIMAKLKEKYAGRCDFSLVSKIARQKLT
jgi:hypothetical protein